MGCLWRGTEARRQGGTKGRALRGIGLEGERGRRGVNGRGRAAMDELEIENAGGTGAPKGGLRLRARWMK